MRLTSAKDNPGLLRLTREESLSLPERVTMLAVIGVLVIGDVIGIIFTPGADVPALLLSVATTSAFALFLWSPWIATATLGIVFGLSFLTGTEFTVILAAAVAAGLVMRLGSTALIFTYLGSFLVATAIVAYGDLGTPVNVGIYLIIATVAGAIGFALRVASARGHRLEEKLAVQAEQERQAVLAERRWIAGELHDSIAHHLTVVALHVQMLDDPKISRDSQEAISAAARKAMADLRFVIELADDGPRASVVQTGDLAEAIDEARTEIEAAGHPVVTEGDPRDGRLPRIAEIVLGRIVRESATNILKHAGAGEVVIRLVVDDEAAALTITSPLPHTPRRDLPSSGTGLNRMAERVIGASGQFSAQAVDGQWRVSARLPVT
ncbi:sensor histidine kinase [Microbacterium tenebrionis]|uniref:sensor histidine kinase n=1 Tax=Microbacterium tenebrionis TaxID=2830665 RepID=UPI00158A7E7E|nr:histidine kinase [Microbacterium ihumii]